MVKENKYVKVERLLYAYKQLPLKIRNIEIDLELGTYTNIEHLEAELQKLKLMKEKIDLMMELLTDKEREIINLRYVQQLKWDQVEARQEIPPCYEVSSIRRIKNHIINKKLMSMIN